MNTKILLFFIFCATLMIAYTTVMAQNSVQITNNKVEADSGNSMNNINNYSTSTTGQYTRSFQRQKNNISNSNSTPRRQSYVLSVSANADTQLTGQIIVNGVIVKEIKENRTSINLSPHLLSGRQKIEISGSYKPASSSVYVELSGPGTEVSQQTGGDGRLKQTLIINVS